MAVQQQQQLVLPLGELAETERLGAALAAVARRGDVIFLHGDLGAGKTALARGFLRHYFLNPDLDVPSPSYLLHFTYKDEGEDAVVASDGEAAGSLSAEDTVAGSTHGRDFRGGRFAALPGVAVHHLDPYRLPEGRIAGLVEFEKMFASDISLIEWPERLGEQLVTLTSPPRLELTLGAEGGHIQAGERIASLRAVGSRWEALLAEWRGLSPPGSMPPVPVTDGACAATTAGNRGAGVSTSLNPTPARHDAVPGSDGGTQWRLPEDPSEWRVLGIESSCDDTGAAVITGTGQVLGEALASQEKVHERWGGVVPKLAQQAHQEAIDGTVEEALRRAGVTAGAPSPQVGEAAGSAVGLTAIAVTVGPGLGPCLQVGVKKAYELASRYSLPIVRVHHMEAHAMVTRLPAQHSTAPTPEVTPQRQSIPGTVPLRAAVEAGSVARSLNPGFPFMTVLVSGGHNMVLLTTGIGKHTILGSTLDDSIGEAFDKTARLLGITHIPGGPHLEELASKGDPKSYALPLPLSNAKDLAVRHGADFSFAGLKTAVRQLVQKHLPPAEEKEKHEQDANSHNEGREVIRANIAACFQARAVQHLSQRVERALTWAVELVAATDTAQTLQGVVVAGGVAANKSVRAAMTACAARHGVTMYCPPPRLCVDNGVMVAWSGVERLHLNLWEEPPQDASKVELFVEVRPRWPLGPRDSRSRDKPQMKPRPSKDSAKKQEKQKQHAQQKRPNEKDPAAVTAAKKSKQQ